MPLTMSPGEECMADCMHELKHKGSKERPQKQRVAICLKHCGQSKGDIIVNIIEDFQVSAHIRKGRVVQAYQKTKKQLKAEAKEQYPLVSILSYAKRQLKWAIKELEKELVRAFKQAKPDKYKAILREINDKREKIEKLTAEIRKRGFTDFSEAELREMITKLEQETEGMNMAQTEAYFRAKLMPYYSVNTIITEAQDLQEKIIDLQMKQIKIQQDALSASAAVGAIKTLLGGVKQKIGGIKTSLAEKRERKLAFYPYTPVDSTNIAGMEYSDKMLKVTFKHKEGDREYGYDVDPDMFTKMENAPSKGAFLWDYLRGREPGYVIDNPQKMTPGGVGGSIVPYTKLSKRAVSPKEFKSLQKEYAKMIKGKVKVISKTPFVQKKEQKVSKEEGEDFVWITIKALSDDVNGDFTRKGHWRKNPDGTRTWVRESKEVEEKVKAYDRSLVERRRKRMEKLKESQRGITLTRDPPKKISKPTPKKVMSEAEVEVRLYELERLMERFPERYEAEYVQLSRKHAENERKARELRRKLEQPVHKDPIDQKIMELKQRGMHSKQELQKWLLTNASLTEIPKYLKAWDKVKMIKEDAVPTTYFCNICKTNHYYNSEIGKEHQKKSIIAGLKGKPKPELPKTEKQKKEEKKAQKRKPAQTEEQKRRKEIDKQARGQKAPKPLEPREEAIQKLIEQTGLERERAEKIIAKKMGLSPSESKKLAEKKAKIRQFNEKNKLLMQKINALSEINQKIQSQPLKNILSLFKKAIYLAATGKDPKRFLKQFGKHYMAIKKATNLQKQYKSKLLSGITQLEQEIKALAPKIRGDGFLSPKTRYDAITYVSRAVDECARERLAERGGKGNYEQEVEECVRLIGIARRRAGLQPRGGGTGRERRRLERRERVQRRIEERRETLREQQERARQARQREQERLNALVEMKHEIERLLGESNLQDARRVLQWMGTNVSLLSEGEIRSRWVAQVNSFDNRITRAEQERQSELVRQRREEVRRRRLERGRPTLRRRREEREERQLREAEGQGTLREGEGSEVMTEAEAEITPEAYVEMYGGQLPPSWARLTPPPGTVQVRRGHWTSGGVWRNPVFRTQQQIRTAQQRRVQIRSRTREYRRIPQPAGETARERASRSLRRRRGGKKMRWDMKIWVGSQTVESLSDIRRTQLRRAGSLTLQPIAKKDYNFVNPDFDPTKPEQAGNRRRIMIRKGESAGTAEFRVQHHRETGMYLYLGLLKMKPDYRGRGAASSVLKPAIMMADRLNLVVGGSPSPLDRDREVAPQGLSRRQQEEWRSNNRRDLDRFYMSLEGEPNYEYGGSFARFPHPERIGRRRRDLVKKVIFFKFPEYLADIGGYLFYYDPETDGFYQITEGGK